MLRLSFPFSDCNVGSKMLASKSWHVVSHFQSENGNNGYRCSKGEVFPGDDWQRQDRRQEMHFNAVNIYPKKYLNPIFRKHNPQKIAPLLAPQDNVLIYNSGGCKKRKSLHKITFECETQITCSAPAKKPFMENSLSKLIWMSAAKR